MKLREPKDVTFINQFGNTVTEQLQEVELEPEDFADYSGSERERERCVDTYDLLLKMYYKESSDIYYYQDSPKEPVKISGSLYWPLQWIERVAIGIHLGELERTGDIYHA